MSIMSDGPTPSNGGKQEHALCPLGSHFPLFDGVGVYDMINIDRYGQTPFSTDLNMTVYVLINLTIQLSKKYPEELKQNQYMLC